MANSGKLHVYSTPLTLVCPTWDRQGSLFRLTSLAQEQD
jgi:hypothetical protein